ncbi:hypothetical protein ED733_004203 [Metarhizium rileyi]|uniref:Uncharacterized protein n=1 Tax=Metarhizium rileyi (strain RCEF 4871) TaxID=1649241 RepID=A0A5C6G9Y4_METRR|nr:hypothetical protein ED733_004203 [Metarhizium rileyi]
MTTSGNAQSQSQGRKKKMAAKRSLESSPNPPSKRGRPHRRPVQKPPVLVEDDSKDGVRDAKCDGDDIVESTMRVSAREGANTVAGSQRSGVVLQTGEAVDRMRDSQPARPTTQTAVGLGNMQVVAEGGQDSLMTLKPSRIVLKRKRTSAHLSTMSQQQQISQKDDSFSDGSIYNEETESENSEASDTASPFKAGSPKHLAPQTTKRARFHKAQKDRSTEQATASPRQSRAATRLLRMMPHLGDITSSVTPDNWDNYLGRIQAYANSEAIREADFGQRLRKLTEIVYLGEELDAIAAQEWDRLLRIAELCSIIAETLGPEDEIIRDETRDGWIRAKKNDIDSLKKLLGGTKFKS